MNRELTSNSTPCGLMRDPPAGSRRWWILAGIAVVLGSQAVIPSIYYLRGEPTRERFAWRMFSTVHLTHWQCRVVETIRNGSQLIDRDVPLEAILEESSVASMHAGQLDIVEPFLRRWLERPGVERVEYTAQGVMPNGQLTEPIRLIAQRGEPSIRRER